MQKYRDACGITPPRRGIGGGYGVMEGVQECMIN